MLQGSNNCYRALIFVLQGSNNGVAGLFVVCYRGVMLLLQGCYKVVDGFLHFVVKMVLL